MSRWFNALWFTMWHPRLAARLFKLVYKEKQADDNKVNGYKGGNDASTKLKKLV